MHLAPCILLLHSDTKQEVVTAQIAYLFALSSLLCDLLINHENAEKNELDIKTRLC